MANDRSQQSQPNSVAIVSLAGRFPKANSPEELWKRLAAGENCITRYSNDELIAAGIPHNQVFGGHYVPAWGSLTHIDTFDPALFGLRPEEATYADPQLRILLECAWECLERGGYSPSTYAGKIGVFAGATNNDHFVRRVEAITGQPSFFRGGIFRLLLDRDYFSTQLSYRLNLRGPSVTLKSACSTSLVAIHMACRSVLNGECDMALAGGVSVAYQNVRGYEFAEGTMLSSDGYCRAFDAEAGGAVFGSGVGLVLLKRLNLAIEDGDNILAVIRGSAINNDGKSKVGFTAPSTVGQAEVIRDAINAAGVNADDITYVETHGTGTKIGDPIEISALNDAFRLFTDRTEYCRIGSLKPNIGHLDAAAGVASVIKVVLALEHEQLPPSINYFKPNPAIDFPKSPFYVNHQATEWCRSDRPRLAGVSSFGFGGTNAHIIIEEAPKPIHAPSNREYQLIPLSAMSDEALARSSTLLHDVVESTPDLSLPDVSYTLASGRTHFACRRCVVANQVNEGVEQMQRRCSEGGVQAALGGNQPPLVFMFSGQGSQYPGMALRLYKTEPLFRESFDACADAIASIRDLDIRSVVFGDDAARLTSTALAQPSLFSVEYALARLLIAWGIVPSALIGHSVGEYVAACISGCVSLVDALKLVALRGELMSRMEPGAMLSIQADVQRVKGFCRTLDIAAVNAPQLCVASGSQGDIEQLTAELDANGISSRRLTVSHAFHSRMMEPALPQFREIVEGISFKPQQIPIISNLTGGQLSDEEIATPDYWTAHMRKPVLFGPGISRLYESDHRMFVEIGPGNALATLARLNAGLARDGIVVASMPHPQANQPDDKFLLNAVGTLWEHGVPIDWDSYFGRETRRRVQLHTYPFSRERFWDDRILHPDESLDSQPAGASDDFASSFVPKWRREYVDLPANPGIPLGRLGVAFVTESTSKAFERFLASLAERVIKVYPSTSFTNPEEDVFTLSPDCPDHYDRLFEVLDSTGESDRFFLHAWTTDRSENPDALSQIDALLNKSYYSLIELIVRLGKYDASPKQRLVVLSSSLFDPDGTQTVEPEKAVVLGPIKVGGLEYPNVSACLIDLDVDDLEIEETAAGIRAVVGRCLSAKATNAMAIRGRNLWTIAYDKTSLDEGHGDVPLLKLDGTYLITGGLGGIGSSICKHIQSQSRAKFVLLGRSLLPEESQWDGILDSVPQNDAEREIQLRVRAMAAFKDSPTPVRYYQADIANLEQTRDVVARIEREVGPISGVFHCAGVADGAMIARRTKSMSEMVLGPKLIGSFVLEKVFADKDLDFLALFSSIAAIVPSVGQVAYTAANAFLDSYAQARRSRRVFSINWCAWMEVGMAAESRSKALRGDSISQFAAQPIDKAAAPLLTGVITQSPRISTYLSKLSVDRDWVLDEHRTDIRGGVGVKAAHALMPATGYLELVLEAFRHNLGCESVQLRDVMFMEMALVRDTEVLSLETTITQVEGESGLFGFRIVRPADGDGQRESVELVKGFGSVLSESAAERVSIDEIRARCSSNVRVYRNSEVGRMRDAFIYGRRWQCFEWSGASSPARECLAQLALPESCRSETELFVCHPALIDIATAHWAMLGTEIRWVPWMCASLKLFKRIPASVYAHLEFEPERVRGEVCEYKVTLYSDEGERLAVFDSYCLRNLGSLAPSGSTAVDWLSNVNVTPVENEGASVTATLSAKDWILREHSYRASCGNRVSIVPSALFIDFIFRAARRIPEFEHGQLQDLVFIGQCAVPEAATVTFETRCVCTDGFVRCEIIRRDAAAEHGAIVASCSLIPFLSAPRADRLILDEIKSRCQTSISGGEFLQRRERSGVVAFGEHWGCLKATHFNDREFLTELELPEPFLWEQHRSWAHPCFLDCAVMDPRACLNDSTDLEEVVAIGSVRLVRPFLRKVFAYGCGAFDPVARTTTLDVLIVDEDGFELANLSNVVIARRPREIVAESLERMAGDARPSVENLALVCPKPGRMQSLAFVRAGRRSPGAGEIEVEMKFAGLNFREVLIALGLLPATSTPYHFGLEGAGVVARVGSDVTGFEPGNEVVVTGTGCFSPFITTNEANAAPVPANMPLDLAASLPLVYTTAHHALVQSGRLKRGESILIHAAAGGVGLAAVHIARQIGVTIYATAGSEAKREYLRDLGVAGVFDSRSDSFVEDVLLATNGRGVDLVLNSLSGELMLKTFDVLAPLGRFLEIGVRDILTNTPLPLKPFAKCLSYHALMVGPALPGYTELLRDVVQLVGAGIYDSVPITTFDAGNVADAFDLMAKARHVGKIVVRVPDRLDQIVAESAVPATPELVERPNPRAGNGRAAPAASDGKSQANDVEVFGISPAEGMRKLLGVMRENHRQVVVSNLRIDKLSADELLAASTRHLVATKQSMSKKKTTFLNRPALSSKYTEPNREIEKALTEIFEHALETKPIGLDDNFFELGGDSIIGVNVISAITERWNVGLPSGVIFDSPTVRELCARIDAAMGPQVQPE